MTDGKGPLSKRTTDDLIDLLKHPNVWFSREARRILMERRDPTAYPRLTEIVRSNRDHHLALEAVWALHASGGLTEELALSFLEHPSEHIRAWAVRFLGDRSGSLRSDAEATTLRDRLAELARREPSATVRNQLACTCKRLPGSVALRIIEHLLRRSEDASDPQIPLLLWWAIESKAVSDRDQVLKLVDAPKAWSQRITQEVIVERMARRYLAEGKPEDFASVARLLTLAPTPTERERLFRALDQQMDGLHFSNAPQALAEVLKPLLEKEHPSAALVRFTLRLGLKSAFPLALACAGDGRLPADERASFIRALGEMNGSGTLTTFLELLRSAQPVVVHSAVLSALQRFDVPEVATAIITCYPKLPPTLQGKARDILVSRPSWSAAALTAVDKGGISPMDFSLEEVRRMLLHKDPSLKERVEKRWGQVRLATSREKQGRILAIAKILEKGQGEATRGKALVAKNCLACHQLFGEGGKIGPDLTAADRKNLEVLLPNIVDPSALVREEYQQYIVVTVDGRVLSGILAENTAAKATFVDSKGVRLTLLKKDIETMTRAQTSLMPEGILDTLSDQEMRDLFAYLRSDRIKP